MALASLVIPARSAARRTIRPRSADLGAARQDKEDRPVSAFAGGQVDRPGGAGRRRDGDGLAALTGDGQRPIRAFQAQLLDIDQPAPTLDAFRRTCPAAI